MATENTISIIDDFYLASMGSILRHKMGVTTKWKPNKLAQVILDLNLSMDLPVDEVAIKILDGTVTSIIDDDIPDPSDPTKTIKRYNITSIADYAFYGCTSLVEAYLPACGSIKGYAFTGCTNLETINLSNCTSLSDHAFEGCSSLANLTATKISGIPANAFAGCSSLPSYFSSKGGTIYQNAFANCTSLTEVQFNEYAYLYNCFPGCSNLEKLTLLSPTVCRCDNPSSYFASTKLLNDGVHIFVPEDMVNIYKEDTVYGWSTIAGHIGAYIPPETPEGGE